MPRLLSDPALEVMPTFATSDFYAHIRKTLAAGGNTTDAEVVAILLKPGPEPTTPTRSPGRYSIRKSLPGKITQTLQTSIKFSSICENQIFFCNLMNIVEIEHIDL